MNIKKGSIKKRIITRFSSLIAVSMMIMLLFFTYLITSNMEHHAQLSLENRANSIQDKIEQRLNYLIENTKLLAKNELMINSLIDDDGKEKYLPPLVKNFIDGKNVKTLHIVDFDGKAIYKTHEDIPQYSDSIYLRRSLAMGETTYYLNKLNNQIVVISPIKYYNTTQGSLVAEFDFNKILDKYVPNDKFAYIKIFKDGKSIYNYNFDKNEKYYSYLLSSNITPIFKKLDVALEMGLLESIYLEPIDNAMYKLSLLGLFVLIIGIIIAYFLSISITNPILKLYSTVKKEKYEKEYEPLGTNDELEVLAEAFYERTKKLHQSEEKYLNLYNNSPDMYTSVDAKTAKVINCNSRFMEKLGYLKDDIIGKEIFDFYNPDSLDEVHNIFNQFTKNGNVNNAELQLMKKDGTPISVLVNASAIRDQDGNILHSNTTYRDITDRIKYEKHIKENERLLFQQSKMAAMGEMIGNIAHQWRQPIAIISMWANNIKADIELEMVKNDTFNEYANNIINQTQHLSQTIDDFKNFFTPNKDKNEFLISHSIDKTMDLLSASFKTHDIEVIKNIEDIKITAYENELTQAILNIIKNAKDILITLENTKRLLFINTYTKNNMLFLEIIDSGGGVPKDIIEKVFEPYFTTKDKTQGTGIGLYMTESIITKHLGGKIYIKNVEYEYENENYKGAKFIIEIPLDN